jgi:hypothetical protein
MEYMSTRTVRLDDDSERILAEISRAKGLSVSAAFKQGLVALRDSIAAQGPVTTPYSIYRTIDLGDGDALAPARSAKREIRRVLKRKARR